jgi:DNA-binding transcriptional ArsR family regulator
MDELTIHQTKFRQALADPKRIQILYALDGHLRHVSGLGEDLNIPQPTVSRHL